MQTIQLETALQHVRPFMPKDEYKAIKTGLAGEESEYFAEKLQRLAELLKTMPRVYGQDGKGDQAIAYLHYFKGNMDWWITELDSSKEQHQAFGLADIGYGGELGYISIVEIVTGGVELDLHWQPKTLAEIKQKHSTD
jgi:hypothetical protein